MKKLLIILTFIGIAINSFSQFVHFFPNSNAYFSVSYFKYWFEGDTIINSYQYKKVFKQTGNPIANFDESVYYAALREDTIAERVYCIVEEDGIERLLYDFSLNVGDTISISTY